MDVDSANVKTIFPLAFVANKKSGESGMGTGIVSKISPEFPEFKLQQFE